MTLPSSKLSARLARDAFRVCNESLSVCLDDDNTETKQTYLKIHGTPDGFRWFAKLLTELSANADASTFDQVIISGVDLDSVLLVGWDSIHLECERDNRSDRDGRES